MEKIKIGIVGYGNLGKSVGEAVLKSGDTEGVAVFTRREPGEVKTNGIKAVSLSDILLYKDKTDVLLLCGGSKEDLTDTALNLIKDFNTVDSFDTHSKIPAHLKDMNAAAKKSGRLSVISAGWDPGIFSLQRTLFSTALPGCDLHTFWGDGVSQGHSDALRKINGVKLAVEYTVPKAVALKKVRSGEGGSLTKFDRHLRDCYVVLEAGANGPDIEKQIKEMPDYFKDYDTRVNFITEKEFNKSHIKMPHGGFVLAAKKNQNGKFLMEFSLKLASNPDFTAGVLLCYARACHRLFKEGKTGALSVLDVPFSYLSEKDRMELVREYV